MAPRASSSCSSGWPCRGRSPGTDPLTRQKELLARFRMASQDERQLDPRRAARAPGRELPGARSRRDPGSRRVRRAAVRLLPGGRAGPAGAGALDDARRAAAARAPARAARARGVAAAARRRCPSRRRSSGRPRATCTSTASPPAELAEAEAIDALLRIDAPENTRALAGVDPARMTRAAARARAGARGDAGAALVRDAVADAGGRAAGRACRPATSRRSSRGALFLDRDDPVAAWRELARVAGCG